LSQHADCTAACRATPIVLAERGCRCRRLTGEPGDGREGPAVAVSGQANSSMDHRQGPRRPSVRTSGRRQPRRRTAVAVESADPTEHRHGAAGFCLCLLAQARWPGPTPTASQLQPCPVSVWHGNKGHSQKRSHSRKHAPDKCSEAPEMDRDISFIQAQSQTVPASIAGCQCHSQRHENTMSSPYFTCAGH
jgi:hypothetical protein